MHIAIGIIGLIFFATADLLQGHKLDFGLRQLAGLADRLTNTRGALVGATLSAWENSRESRHTRCGQAGFETPDVIIESAWKWHNSPMANS